MRAWVMPIEDVQHILVEAYRSRGTEFAMMVRNIVEPVASVSDPAELTRAATEMLAALSLAEVAVATLRDVAVTELIEDKGLSYSEVARVSGLSKSRIGQLRKLQA